MFLSALLFELCYVIVQFVNETNTKVGAQSCCCCCCCCCCRRCWK